MKSAAPFVLLAGICAQAAALTIAGPAEDGHTLDGRSSGVVSVLPQPHDQVRLLHKHPVAPVRLRQDTSEKRAGTPSSVQGGAVLSVTEKKVQTVTGTFRVPEAKMPTEGPTGNNPVGVYAASFWVGIDGVMPGPATAAASCDPSLASLRLGVDIFYDGTLGGEQTPFAWYQYLPRSAAGFGNFTVAPGDVVRLTASAATGGQVGGTVTIENFGNDSESLEVGGGQVSRRNKKKEAIQTATHVFTSPSPDGSLLPPICQTQAAWIVEDFPLAGLPDFPIALTNFTKIEFGKLGVKSNKGCSISLGKAQVLDIHQEPQGGRLTDCGIRKEKGEIVSCERVVIG